MFALGTEPKPKPKVKPKQPPPYAISASRVKATDLSELEKITAGSGGPEIEAGIGHLRKFVVGEVVDAGSEGSFHPWPKDPNRDVPLIDTVRYVYHVTPSGITVHDRGGFLIDHVDSKSPVGVELMKRIIPGPDKAAILPRGSVTLPPGTYYMGGMVAGSAGAEKAQYYEPLVRLGADGAKRARGQVNVRGVERGRDPLLAQLEEARKTAGGVVIIVSESMKSGKPMEPRGENIGLALKRARRLFPQAFARELMKMRSNLPQLVADELIDEGVDLIVEMAMGMQGALLRELWSKAMAIMVASRAFNLALYAQNDTTITTAAQLLASMLAREAVQMAISKLQKGGKKAFGKARERMRPKAAPKPKQHAAGKSPPAKAPSAEPTRASAPAKAAPKPTARIAPPTPAKAAPKRPARVAPPTPAKAAPKQPARVPPPSVPAKPPRQPRPAAPEAAAPTNGKQQSAPDILAELFPDRRPKDAPSDAPELEQVVVSAGPSGPGRGHRPRGSTAPATQSKPKASPTAAEARPGDVDLDAIADATKEKDQLDRILGNTAGVTPQPRAPEGASPKPKPKAAPQGASPKPKPKAAPETASPKPKAAPEAASPKPKPKADPKRAEIEQRIAQAEQNLKTAKELRQSSPKDEDAQHLQSEVEQELKAARRELADHLNAPRRQAIEALDAAAAKKVAAIEGKLAQRKTLRDRDLQRARQALRDHLDKKGERNRAWVQRKQELEARVAEVRAAIQAIDAEVDQLRGELAPLLHGSERKTLQDEIEAEQRAALGINPDWYRRFSTTARAQARAMLSATPAKNDAIYGTPLVDPEADHVVPLHELSSDPDFRRLSYADQLAVANLPENLQWLSGKVNASKGSQAQSSFDHRAFATAHDGFPTLGPEDAQRVRDVDKRAREAVKKEIKARLAARARRKR